jgi:cell division control protein 7
MPGACLHGPPTAKNPHGENKVRYQYNPESVVKLQREARAKSKLPSEKVGYPDKDTRYAFVHLSGIFSLLYDAYNSLCLCRPVSKANRAGTRGFRAPEVLLKCGEQTGGMLVPPFV